MKIASTPLPEPRSPLYVAVSVMLYSFNRAFAVACSAGGLEGRRPSKVFFFWPVTATDVAVTGQRGGFRGRLRLPRTLTAYVLSFNKCMASLGKVSLGGDPLDYLGEVWSGLRPLHTSGWGSGGGRSSPPDPHPKL